MASEARRTSRRSPRERPAKPPLSEAAVIDAALRILRSEGLEAVTMRRVAAELDTGPASLYVYVRGRDELRGLMIDRVLDTDELPPADPERWREQVHAELQRWLEALVAHPGIAAVAVASPPTSEDVLALSDHVMGLLLLGGVTPQDAAWACDLLPLIVTMTAIEADTHRARGNTIESFIGRMDAVFSALDPARFPHLSRYKDEMLAGDGDVRFHFAIDVILDGLVARAGAVAGAAQGNAPPRR